MIETSPVDPDTARLHSDAEDVGLAEDVALPESAARSEARAIGGARRMPLSDTNATRDDVLVALARRYAWDMDPRDAPARRERVILRVMDIGTVEDTALLEGALGAPALRDVLDAAPIGSLRPRSRAYWSARVAGWDGTGPAPRGPARATGPVTATGPAPTSARDVATGAP